MRRRLSRSISGSRSISAMATFPRYSSTRTASYRSGPQLPGMQHYGFVATQRQRHSPYYADLTSVGGSGPLSFFVDGTVSTTTGAIDFEAPFETPPPATPAFRVTWFNVGVPGYSNGTGTIQLVLFDIDGSTEPTSISNSRTTCSIRRIPSPRGTRWHRTPCSHIADRLHPMVCPAATFCTSAKGAQAQRAVRSPHQPKSTNPMHYP